MIELASKPIGKNARNGFTGGEKRKLAIACMLLYDLPYGFPVDNSKIIHYRRATHRLGCGRHQRCADHIDLFGLPFDCHSCREIRVLVSFAPCTHFRPITSTTLIESFYLLRVAKCFLALLLNSNPSSGALRESTLIQKH